MTNFFLSEELRKIINNPGVLKMTQYCSRRKDKAEYLKRRKGGKWNGNLNDSNMDTEISHTDITALHTSQTDDNSIPSQVQMLRMGRKT